jgi:hypothetical protein
VTKALSPFHILSAQLCMQHQVTWCALRFTFCAQAWAPGAFVVSFKLETDPDMLGQTNDARLCMLHQVILYASAIKKESMAPW